MRDYRVRVGSNFNSKGGDVHQVSDSIIHPEYNKTIMEDYDVALLKLKTPITIVKNVKQIIKLPKASDFLYVGSAAFISGWGFKDPSATTIVEKLRGARVLTELQRDCIWAYSYVMEITDRMFCAARTGTDACQVS